MHNMCSEANFYRLSGTNVERDFVEMPSQMLENWIWDKEILKKVSKHYITNLPLSDEMIDKKVKSKNEFGATAVLELLFKSTFDFIFHSFNDPSLISNSPGLA